MYLLLSLRHLSFEFSKALATGVCDLDPADFIQVDVILSTIVREVKFQPGPCGLKVSEKEAKRTPVYVY